jgi:hypothetical protein
MANYCRAVIKSPRGTTMFAINHVIPIVLWLRNKYSFYSFYSFFLCSDRRLFCHQDITVAGMFGIAGFSANRIQQPACSDRRLFCQQDTAAGMFRSPSFLPTGYSSRHVQNQSANRIQQPACSDRRLFCQQNTAAAGMFRPPAFLPTGYSSRHVQISGFSANRIQQPACSDCRLFCQKDTAAAPAFLPKGYSSRHVQIAGFSANRIQQPGQLFCQQDTAAAPAFLPTGYNSRLCSDRRPFCQQEGLSACIRTQWTGSMKDVLITGRRTYSKIHSASYSQKSVKSCHFMRQTQ